MATKIPLEDNYDDIIGKASRGLKIPVAEMPPASDEDRIRQLAQQLHLGADALVASAWRKWYPADTGRIDGLECFNTKYEDMTVNSYVVFDPKTKEAAAFDTGADCSGMLALPVKIQQIFITHIHGDHVLDLARLKEKTGAKAFVSEREPVGGAEPFPDGKVFSIGSLKVETRRTSGHSRGGVTYVVTGLSRRLAIVGDAMFAGSMGGGMVDYREALETNRANILSLPDDTVICPGHGPLATVGEQKLHNPFFAV
jgi:glyoxylase-like metal-dependent hydrolase (beta-lactamase superfamily II)